MKTEIGSEFWNIPVSEENHLFPDYTQWFISGRSALQAILKENNFKTAAVPFWCCDSMIVPFLNCNISVVFYKDVLPDTDVALVIDYFGYTGSCIDKSIFNGVIIRDLTHSIFSKSYYDADYYFGSLRKWAGFLTGGFAWGFKNKVIYEGNSLDYSVIRSKAMNMKADYINGKTDKKDYLSVFSAAENLLESVNILPADPGDIIAARNLDVGLIVEQRRKNAKVLLDELKHIALFPKLNDSDCPMFVPVIVKKRDELRKYLIENKIYCPVHWPISKFNNLNEYYKDFYNAELSLVCDQRYCEDDMFRIVETVRNFYNGDYINA